MWTVEANSWCFAHETPVCIWESGRIIGVTCRLHDGPRVPVWLCDEAAWAAVRESTFRREGRLKLPLGVLWVRDSEYRLVYNHMFETKYFELAAKAVEHEDGIQAGA